MELLTGVCIKGLSQVPLNYCQDGFLTGFLDQGFKNKNRLLITGFKILYDNH